MAIVPAAQLIDWTACGVSGGVDARTTIHSTISSAGGTAPAPATSVYEGIVGDGSIALKTGGRVYEGTIQ